LIATPLLALGALAGGFALLAAPAASAATPSAGWSISSVAQPTNLSAADSEIGVESLTVKATGGEYELSVLNRITEKETETALIQWDASAQELQLKLEEVPGIGSGNVKVTGGPGDATGSHPYTIEWPGKFAGWGANAFENGHVSKLDGTAENKTEHEAKFNDRYLLRAVNVGSRPAEGEVTIADSLPEGVIPVKMEVEEPRTYYKHTCAVTVPLKCIYDGEVNAGGELRVILYVGVVSSGTTGPLVNEASVSGGGGGEAKTSETNAVNVGPAPFGIDQLAFDATGPEGGPDMQAGDHPYAVTTTIDLNTVFTDGHPPPGAYAPAREVKDVSIELPLGFAGDPLAAERCPEIDFANPNNSCQHGSRVGTVTLIREGATSELRENTVYNVVPTRGFPAELGFESGFSQPIVVYASVVPSKEGYRLRFATPGALGGTKIEAIALTVFGSPGEHNGTGAGAAFITNPSACSGEPLTVRAEVTAWEGGSDVKDATAYPSITGCDLLTGSASFSPSLEVRPETTQADTPSGYEVDLKVPQAPNLFGALATSDLKNATVTLPAGVSVSPSAASGPDALEGCTEAQIDLLGTELGEGHPGGNGSPYDDGLPHASPGHCPAKSQIGTVEVKTPLLEEPLKGHVYVAQPSCGGAGQPECTEQAAEEGKVFGLYLEMAGSGVIIKQAGSVEVGGYGAHNGLAVGQLRARFDENPQFPFEDLKMVFSGGQRSALANPQTCGTATTTSDLEPWSAPESGANATPSWPFAVTGCGGGFAPSFSAGTVAPLAGAFSPFTLTFSRQDREQDLSGLTVTMPPGLLGALKGVEQCPEPQTSKGECGAGSLIGHDQVAAGAGSEPLWETGRVYLTGPYRGAPFGLSIVTPAVAGPFNLGNVVVRATIAINPSTAQITTTSDPFPQLVDGVPLRIKTVNVTIDRSGFMFNPTNCDQQQLAGTISSAQGTSVAVSTPFAAAGCANLPFAPKLTASAGGHASKAGGASLDVKITSAGVGQANIAKVDLQLPTALPSRLSTLQKACLAAVFNANPAACEEDSVIGKATIHTPILNAPLTGPAYLVSHGGAAFPDVEFVLQGEGVTLILDGKTDIKNGITYSRFESTPDAPFTTFETELPTGPHSILAAYLPASANYNLCGTSLAMPTEITAQNGAVIKQSTNVAITGCPPALTITRTKVKGNTVLVTVKVGEAGTVKITGRGLRTTTKKGVKAGTHTITVPLTNIGRAAKKHKRKLKIKATLTVAGRTGTATTTLKA
jgi:hypothetical protein